MSRFGKKDYVENDNNDNEKNNSSRWWVPYEWPTYIKYIVMLSVMLYVIIMSTNKIGAIIACGLLYGFLVLPKIIFQYVTNKNVEYEEKNIFAENRKKEDQTILSPEQEQTFKKLTEDFYKQ